MNDSSRIKKIYQEKYKKHGLDPRSLCWHERGAAHQRFRQFWAEIDFTGKSVLDVGCGFGEMAKFLSKRYKGVSYTGVDIVPEFIEEAKKLYPEDQFFVGDYFTSPLDGKFDVILASGVLNSNVTDNMGFREKAVQVLFEHTKKILAFNMLGAYPQPENDPTKNVWYADTIEVVKYCKSLTRRIILRAHYHPTDFTVFMFKVKD